MELHLAIIFSEVQNLWNCGIMRYLDKLRYLDTYLK